MKTAAKVFIIIGMVFQFWLIVPLIVGIIALNKLNKATSKADLVGIGIVTLIFCNLIGGILMLCLKDEDLAPAVVAPAAPVVEANATEEAPVEE